MPPALALQPELPCCAQLRVWSSLPFAFFALLFQTFLLPPLGYTDLIQGEQPRAAGIHVPSMPMRSGGSALGCAGHRGAVPEHSHAADVVLWVPPKGEMESQLAPTTTLQARPWKLVVPQSWVTSGSAVRVPGQRENGFLHLLAVAQVRWCLTSRRKAGSRFLSSSARDGRMSAFPGEHTNCYLCLQLLQPRRPAQQLALTGIEACSQSPPAVPATGSPGPVSVWALMQKILCRGLGLDGRCSSAGRCLETSP